jgi:two-component system, OmpR family, KDP operon response regulator KdpE
MNITMNSIDSPSLPIIGSDLDFTMDRVSPKILIIDDDVDYVDMLKIILRKEGFDVAGAHGFPAAIQKCREVDPNVILLDVLMPDMDGWETFQRLREVTKSPIIFVSAVPFQENVVRGLDIGAEDFIGKPFNNPELIARIKRVLRNPSYSNRPNILRFPDSGIVIDFDAHEVTRNGRSVHLIPREFTLLEILAEHAPRNVPYEKITTQMWGEDSEKNRAHLKTIAFSLKHKLQNDEPDQACIANNRGVGYQLISHPEAGKSL